MIDLKLLRTKPDLWRVELRNRNLQKMPASRVDELLGIDQERRSVILEKNRLEETKNKFSVEIVKVQDPTKRAALIAEMRQHKTRLQELRIELETIEHKTRILLDQFPNLTHASVPVGPDASGNQVDHIWGEKPRFNFPPQTHQILGEKLDLIDTAKGSFVSGTRFWYLKRELVPLEFALIQYSLSILLPKGFVPLLPPMLVRQQAMYGTGFFPADQNEIYALENDEAKGEKLYLIGTAEVPLASYHMEEEIDVTQGKPKLYTGFSSCFRREAGAAGKDLRGIIRGHQFDKLEMFAFTAQEDSWDVYHNLILKTAEEVWQGLKIHYRAVNICTGDLGAPNAKKVDLEAWLPGEGRYLEVVSASHDTDFQARRLQIQYRDRSGKTKFVHMMNSTVVAIGRALVAIMENYQQKDGSIRVPSVLQKYCGLKRITVKRQEQKTRRGS